MIRYFIELAYDGTEYFGWQRQKNAVTVEETITDVLRRLLQDSALEIVGCGRTDTGVSATDYFAHFDTERGIDCGFLSELPRKCNMMLPKDISIRRIFQCSMHARFDAVSREYRYRISRKKDPFNRHAWTVYHPLDVGIMKEGARALQQYHDFTSFAKLHGSARTNLCTIYGADWEEHEDGELVFTISANRFLRGMVRAIVGTMADLGRGKITLQRFREIIESRNRALASMQAPAKGLMLTSVKYPDSNQ